MDDKNNYFSDVQHNLMSYMSAFKDPDLKTMKTDFLKKNYYQLVMTPCWYP